MAERIINLPTGCMGMPLALTAPPCILGCDIRPGSYDLTIADVINSSRDNGKTRVVRPVFIGKVRDEKEMIWVARQYRVKFGVMDSRPDGTLMLRAVKEGAQFGINLWRAEYLTQPSNVEYTKNEKEKLLKLERTMTIDQVHHAFQTGIGVVLPENFQNVNGGQFESEMCASTKTPTLWHGKEYMRWEAKSPDHALHSFNLLMIAARVSGMIRYGYGEQSVIVEGTSNRTVTAPATKTIEEQIMEECQETGGLCFEA